MADENEITPKGTFHVVRVLEESCPKCGSKLQLAEAQGDEPGSEPFRYVRCANLKCNYSARG